MEVGVALKKMWESGYIDKNTVLSMAVRNGDIKIVRFLLDNETEIGFRFQEAAYHGHLDIVLLFLERGMNIHGPHDYGNGALRDASSQGHIEIVELLLNNGLYINYQNGSILSVALGGGHLKVVRLLLERGVDYRDYYTGLKKLLRVKKLPESREELIDLVTVNTVNSE